ncbi:MAG TPA: PQQ-binding-like beta-propeller repeat protein [Roseomonas sp.]
MAALAGLAAWALISRNEAVEQRTLAVRKGEVAAAGLLAAEARTFTGPEPEVAERQALLALEALRIMRENGGEEGEPLSVLSDALTRLPRRIRAFPSQEAPPVLAFSGDGLRLFRGAGSSIEVWTLEGMRAEPPLNLLRSATALLSSPDGRWLAATDAEGGATLLHTGGLEVGVPAPPLLRRVAEAGVRCTAFSPDSEFFAALVAHTDGRREVTVWRSFDGQLRAQLLLPPRVELVDDPGMPCIALGSGPALLATYRPADRGAMALLWPWRSPDGGPAAQADAAAPLLVRDQRMSLGETADRRARGGRQVPSVRSSPLAPPAAQGQQTPPPLFRTWPDVAGAGFAAEGSELLLTRPGQGSSGTLLRISYRSGGLEFKEEEVQIQQGAPGAVAPRGRHFAARTGLPPDILVPLLRGAATQLRSATDGSIFAELAASGRFSADGHGFISAGGHLLRRWDSESGRETLRVTPEVPISDVLDTPGGRYLALVGEDRSVLLIDAAHPLERARFGGLVEMNGTVVGLTTNGDVASISEWHTSEPDSSRPWKSRSTRRTRLVDLGGARTIARFPAAATVVAAPGGSRVAGPFGEPRSFRTLAALPTQPLPGQLIDLNGGGRSLWQSESAADAAFSPDGQLVVFAHEDGRLAALRTVDGHVLWEASPAEPHHEGRTAQMLPLVQISPDGQLVLAKIPPPMLGGDATLAILDARTGTVLRRTVMAKYDAADSVRMAMDMGGTRLAVGREQATVVDLASDRTVRELAPPGTLDHIGKLALLPDGRRLSMVAGKVVSMGLGARFYSEAAVMVWDVEEGRILTRIPPGVDRAVGYEETLGEEEKAYFPDAELSATGRRTAATVYPSRLAYWVTAMSRVQRDAVVWDLEGAVPREVLRRPGMEVAALSQDGRVVLLRRDGVIEARVLDRDDLPQAACARLSRNLSADEWRAHLGDRLYRETCPRLGVR